MFKQPTLTLSLAKWSIVGLLVGVLFALSGLSGLFVSAALAAVVVFAVLAAKFPVPVMGVSIGWFALCPYTLGLQTGLLFRLFADESLVLLYLAAFPLLYLFTARSWRQGFSGLYLVIAILVCTLALSFVSGADLVAYRTFLSTFVVGALLLVVVLQEASNSDPEAIARSVVWVTVLIAALSVVERIVQRNPFVEQSPLYISAEIVRVTGGTYRPYVSFFHPSEAGTFMALGVPFVFRAWLTRRSWFSLLALATAAAGLFVNATRGVWFGVFIAALLALLAVRNVWLLLSATVPLAAIGSWLGYLAFKTSPFMIRLTDPTDLYLRFETWTTAAKIFMAHPLLGVGPMNFTKAYFDYVRATTFTADNMFVSTMVENGLLGLIALVGFFVFALVSLAKSRVGLYGRGLASKAAFVRCTELALISYIATGCFADIQEFRKATAFMFILIGLGLAEGVRYATSTGETEALEDKALHVVSRRESTWECV